LPVRVGFRLILVAAAITMSGSFLPAAAAVPHSATAPWWNLPKFCEQSVADAGASPVLAQTLRRDDHQRHASLHVSVYSTVVVDKPLFVSCAFVDTDGNGALSPNERLTGHVVHATPLGANGFSFDREVVADPRAHVCLVTVVFQHNGLSAPLSSGIACIVNPGTMVPEVAVPALLGVAAAGGLGCFGLVRRRRARHSLQLGA
jgi:hypothetical protein